MFFKKTINCDSPSTTLLVTLKLNSEKDITKKERSIWIENEIKNEKELKRNDLEGFRRKLIRDKGKMREKKKNIYEGRK